MSAGARPAPPVRPVAEAVAPRGARPWAGAAMPTPPHTEAMSIGAHSPRAGRGAEGRLRPPPSRWGRTHSPAFRVSRVAGAVATRAARAWARAWASASADPHAPY